MQRRLVRKRDLEILLTKIAPHPQPRAHLEQYTIPVETATEILYLAAYTYGDIIGKTVIDLGCGTGRLAIGSVILGAANVVAVDVDRVAIKAAVNNAKQLQRDCVQWITAELSALRGYFDTVVQNPPFGVQRAKADRVFLKKALEVGHRIYSLHRSSRANIMALKRTSRKQTPSLTLVPPSSFIERFVEKAGASIKAVYAVKTAIPHIFDFHTKPKHEFFVDLYIIEAGGDDAHG
ncbi:MAG: 50S ribosomal protein L11 methyltransferase [Candidatus Bathyarchaeota archaeon]|nr:MAG: 50S ribosomal protein L11 methyltransferase [Candidatus Bathyarchaeota archaeon]